MHPEIARELIAQRGRELRERAQQAMVARTVIRTRRAMRRGADDFTCPDIPDYVDGSFRAVSPTEDQAASRTGRVPAARRAA
jgi:hypothetical protein